jgi:alpha-1,2-mannosyltransferase
LPEKTPALPRANFPAVPAQRYRRLVRLLIAWLVVSAAAFVPLFGGFLDLHVYRTGGYAWLHGLDLYSDSFGSLVPGSLPLPFTYPPLSAVLFAPVHLLPWHAAKFVMTAISMVALVATTVIVAARTHGDLGRTAAARTTVVGLAAAAGWVAFEPLRQTISFGQVNLILMALVAADCLLPASRLRWPRGLLIGLAAAIKLTPAVFVLFFLVRRQYRPVAVSAGSFLGFGLLGAALAPADSATYWFSTLLDPDRIGGIAYAFNQNFQSVLYRLLPEGAGRSALWLLLVLVALALALAVAARSRAVGDDVTALLVIAVFGLLASPVSWSHHWVWALPAALPLLRWVAGSRARRAVATFILAVFVVGAHDFLPSGNDTELHWSWWQHLLGSSYVLVGTGMLVALVLRRRRATANHSAGGVRRAGYDEPGRIDRHRSRDSSSTGSAVSQSNS